MLKTLFNKEKREHLKEQVEVVFAVFTIVSFVVSKYNKKHSGEDKTEVEESKERCCSEAS